MPHPSRTSAYSKEFESSIRRAFTQGTFTIPAPSPEAAKSLRAKFYCYLTAIRKENDSQELVQMAYALVLTTSGCDVTIFLKEHSWEAETLRKALGEDTPQPPKTSHQTAMEALDTLRKEKAAK